MTFSLGGTTYFTPTLHLGNMIYASWLTVSSGLTPLRPTNAGPKQWLSDLEVPSNEVECFLLLHWSVNFNSDLISSISLHVLLVTSNSSAVRGLTIKMFSKQRESDLLDKW